MKVHGIDVEKHLEKLRETDALSATVLDAVYRENERLKSHINVVSQQCQGYFDDVEMLTKRIAVMQRKNDEQ